MRILAETQTSYIFVDTDKLTALRTPIDEGGSNVSYEHFGNESSYREVVLRIYADDDVRLFVDFSDGRWYQSSPLKTWPVNLDNLLGDIVGLAVHRRPVDHK